MLDGRCGSAFKAVRLYAAKHPARHPVDDAQAHDEGQLLRTTSVAAETGVEIVNIT